MFLGAETFGDKPEAPQHRLSEPGKGYVPHFTLPSGQGILAAFWSPSVPPRVKPDEAFGAAAFAHLCRSLE